METRSLDYSALRRRARAAMRARAREEVAILAGTDRATDGDCERYAAALGLPVAALIEGRERAC